MYIHTSVRPHRLTTDGDKIGAGRQKHGDAGVHERIKGGGLQLPCAAVRRLVATTLGGFRRRWLLQQLAVC